MRKQITLYDDQYAFYKELKSKRLMLAFIEYMFEDIEPTWLKKMEKVIRNSLKIRMDNQKKKSVAWTISRWGWRKKIEETPVDNYTAKTTQKQQKNNKLK